jgi:hypothetical protein
MSTNRNTVARTLHDLGAAAWFGGSLMGSVGVNGAAADVRDPVESTKVAQAGWGRWTPVNLAGIAAHLAGGAMLVWGNKGRLAGQKGVLAATIAKTAVTAGALGLTAYTRVLGEQVMRAGDVPSEGGTTPHPATPSKVAEAQRQLHTLQWTIPALTGTIIGLSAYMGEQQRPSQVSKGAFGRGFAQLGKSVAAGAVVGTAMKKKGAVATTATRKLPKAAAVTWATKTAAKGAKAKARAGR